MNLKDFHGVITKCHCTNPDVPDNCRNCFSRGFTAVCLQCSGTGQITVPVAGAAKGDMRSTCDKCGGSGHFGVAKPATWDAEHAPEPVQAETAVDEEAEFKELTAGAAAADAPDPPDPFVDAIRDLHEESALETALVRPRTIHHHKWKKMSYAEKVAFIEQSTKPAEELVTA